MSRARNIKPGFFKNEELAELPFEFRILFQGLWCLADREGRLEDRPKRIKADIFPYDHVDVDSGLDALAVAGFITRYEHGGCQYIQVLAFAKHQNPHCKEAASTIPAPCLHSADTGTSGTSPADSLNLIPDSLNLIPGEKASPSLSAEADEAAATPPCPHAEIVAIYHRLLPANPRIKVWDGARADALRARWREEPKRQNLDYWQRFFSTVAASKFLTGRTEGREGRPFLPGLEWMVKAANFAKIIEGRYSDGGVA